MGEKVRSRNRMKWRRINECDESVNQLNRNKQKNSDEKWWKNNGLTKKEKKDDNECDKSINQSIDRRNTQHNTHTKDFMIFISIKNTFKNPHLHKMTLQNVNLSRHVQTDFPPGRNHRLQYDASHFLREDSLVNRALHRVAGRLCEDGVDVGQSAGLGWAALQMLHQSHPRDLLLHQCLFTAI